MTQYSRREFVATALGALATACVTRRFAPPPNEQAVSAAGPLERELRIFNWSDYIAPQSLTRFEREFNVRISYDTYESNEEMVAKLVAGGGGYDIVGPTGYLVPVMIEGGLLQPLDRAMLTNWQNLDPLFANAPADAGGRYAMPYQWGLTGIAYRADLVAHVPDSWGAFSDPTFDRRATMLDDGREVLGAMLKWRGHSFNSTDAVLLEAAKRDALSVKPHLRAYVSATVKAQLISGDIAVAQLWNGDARQAAAEEPRVRFVVPREGSMIFTDYLAIPRDAPNRRAAHAFLNYVLRPNVAAEIAEQTGYGAANAASRSVMADPLLPPAPAEMQRLEFQQDLGPATDMWDRAWTEVKAG